MESIISWKLDEKLWRNRAEKWLNYQNLFLKKYFFSKDRALLCHQISISDLFYCKVYRFTLCWLVVTGVVKIDVADLSIRPFRLKIPLDLLCKKNKSCIHWQLAVWQTDRHRFLYIMILSQNRKNRDSVRNAVLFLSFSECRIDNILK